VIVGSQSTLGARSGVTKDVPAGQSYLGFPAAPVKQERHRIASVNRLPHLMERVKELEKKLEGMSPPAASGKE
jgi:UDP-3-O-[3-hydroxymyristoyl] glucosamine N-acyltransferase